MNQFMLGHNARLSALKAADAEEIKKKRLETLRVHIKDGTVKTWNKGLTKETSTKLKEAAIKRSKTVKQQFMSGERITWSKGLTKASDARLKTYSEQQRERFAAGELIPWAKGKTKETDERVAKMAKSISSKMQTRHRQARASFYANRNIELIEHDHVSMHPDIKLLCYNDARFHREWKRPILERDDYTCMHCKERGGNLHVHHDKVLMATIVKSFTDTITDIEQLDYIKSRQIADKIVDYHITSNVSGITLCAKCHAKEHSQILRRMISDIMAFVVPT